MNAFLLLLMLMGQPGIDSGKPVIRNDPTCIPVAPAPQRHAKPVIRN